MTTIIRSSISAAPCPKTDKTVQNRCNLHSQEVKNKLQSVIEKIFMRFFRKADSKIILNITSLTQNYQSIIPLSRIGTGE